MTEIEESLILEEEEEIYYNKLIEIYGEDSLTDDCRRRLVYAFRHECDQAKRMEVTCKEAKQILEWRAKFEMDTILQRTLPHSDLFQACWPSYFYGEDIDGHVITVDILQDIKVEIFQQNLTHLDQLLALRAQFMERLQWEKNAISIRRGVRVTKHISLVDINGFGLKYISPSFLSYMKPIFEIGQTYYPETLHCMYVINVPYIFTSAWKLISSFVSSETSQKIHLLKNKEEFLKVAESNGIGVEAIPVQFGGSHQGRKVDDSFQPSVPDTPLPIATRHSTSCATETVQS
ncbi:unnamed protein product [Albugo candida]|uniref:CRAL-TRIO domain-containing protein n=1 Tax=Albugo candida TaxID=65357 RepID=A0A024GP84_9STRA|nr:unnamed protein product [Albugo candida]|eukprot:CCI48702.1 unnamed protein product [Albugo candida]